MPTQGKTWRHIIICTVNSWLPGDPRGFRAKGHKIHSSGDYKHPPPRGEHAGLWRYSKEISGPAVVIPKAQWESVGRAIIVKLREWGHRVLAVSVSATHSHWLAELPSALPQVRKVVGQCKTASSHAIRGALPGRVWAREGSFKRVRDKQHHVNTFHYILNQKNAWVWSYKDDEDDVCEGEE